MYNNATNYEISKWRPPPLFTRSYIDLKITRLKFKPIERATAAAASQEFAIFTPLETRAGYNRVARVQKNKN